MRLGILLAGRSLDEIGERLTQARDAGYSLCQLNLQQGGCSRPDMVALADRLLEVGIRPVAIGCHVNPMRPDDEGPLGVKKADLVNVLQLLDIVGARRVVVWSGSYADTMFDPHPDNASEEALDALAAFVSDIVHRTGARHYQIVLEPWRDHVLSDEDRIIRFHERLEPAVSEHVRYVLDAPALITPERYESLDKSARSICRAIGPAAGVVHLRDCIMPPDGEPALPGPGEGKLAYADYIDAVTRNAPADAPAIVRNVPPSQYAAARDFLLRLSDKWQLT